MTFILSAVTLFCVVLVILDRVPARYLRNALMDVRVSVRPDHLWVLVACEVFLLEWEVNGRDCVRDRRVDGIRLLLGCENWWTRSRGDILSYRRVVVDSREYGAT